MRSPQKNLGSSYISVMMVAGFVAMVAVSVPNIMKVFKAREYQNYAKNEMNRVESRVRSLLSSPEKYEVITLANGNKEVRLRPQTRQRLAEISELELLGAQCEEGVELCGISLESIQEDLANNKVEITIGFNGENTKLQDRKFSIELPTLERVSNPPVLDSCPQDRPVLAGLDTNGRVLCKSVGEVFRTHASNAELCEVNLVDGCTPRSGKCPAGRYARVNDFKVRCFSLPVASCPLGQAVRNISVSSSGGLSFKCGPVARLDQLVVKPPVQEEPTEGDVDVSLPVEVIASESLNSDQSQADLNGQTNKENKP